LANVRVVQKNLEFVFALHYVQTVTALLWWTWCCVNVSSFLYYFKNFQKIKKILEFLIYLKSFEISWIQNKFCYWNWNDILDFSKKKNLKVNPSFILNSSGTLNLPSLRCVWRELECCQCSRSSWLLS
jgi:hypothetical protein